MLLVSLWASGLPIIMFTFQLPSLESWNHCNFFSGSFANLVVIYFVLEHTKIMPSLYYKTFL